MRAWLILLLCLALTGCGAELTENGGAIRWEDYQQQEEPANEETVVLPHTFTLAYHKDHTLDPITCGEGIQQDVASLLYEPLFTLNAQFEVENVLCESYTVSEDQCVYTLTIRDGVQFSDGSELTAGDVAATLRRAMESERYGYRLRRISGLTYSNRSRTVTVTLVTPSSAFVSLLDIPVVKSGTEQQMVPVGTGPYLFVSTSEGAALTVHADWWQQKSLPVDTISLVHAKDEDTALHLFASDRVELLTIDPTSGYAAVSGQYEETERPTARLHFIGFNTTGGAFAERTVRSTFSAGIQREVLVNAFLSNHAEAAWLPISPLSALYPEELNTTYDYERTLAAYSAALAQLSEETSRELTLLVNAENSFHVNNAGFIAEKLSVDGWKITVRALPWTEYLVALDQGDFDLYYAEVRLTADWDLTDLVGTEGTLNYGKFSDLWLDALIQEFATASDREGAAVQLCRYFVEQSPVAPICFQNDTVFTHTNVVEELICAPSSTFYEIEDWAINLAR